MKRAEDGAAGSREDPADPTEGHGDPDEAKPPDGTIGNVAVMTSGGDAPGMNAAVRAVVRTALHRGLEVFAIREGWRGLVEGGESIRPLASRDVGGILHRGGTVIGTARSPEFRERDGRRQAVVHMIERDIDALVVIGGDGSLTGADVLRREWPDLLEELVDANEISREQARRHPRLRVVGLAGSIDNDLFGTDMTIGTDTALHRLVEAIDAIHDTAASHHRTFVVEAMGRNCGYLALMGALATGANYVLVPEQPPEGDWRATMTQALMESRWIGRSHNLVVVAEGARDREGKPITVDDVKEAIEDDMREEVRVTILGHLQRGGSPSAFDRNMSSLLGYHAVDHLVRAEPEEPPKLVGIREHQPVASPLVECIERTQAVAQRISEGDYDAAARMRGGSFLDAFDTFHTLIQAQPRPPRRGTSMRIAVLHAGGPAPGMNSAVRAAVRLGMDQGHTMLAVRRGFKGLLRRSISTLDWMAVSGWVGEGGAELGTSRHVPDEDGLERVAEIIERHDIDGLLMIGGFDGYRAAHAMHARRDERPGFAIPIVCLPASIDNNLPGSELSVGADTALNAICDTVDRIKQTAVASQRCFVVEVMGRDCGYLALLGGIAVGAEQIFLPEEGIALEDLRRGVQELISGFRAGKRLGLVLLGENADPVYTTGFIRRLFEKEGGDLFDVREARLGHIQQGGAPSPFDRIQATRLAQRCIEYLTEQGAADTPGSAFIGLRSGRVGFTDLSRFPALVERDAARPRVQSWMSLRDMMRVVAGQTQI